VFDTHWQIQVEASDRAGGRTGAAQRLLRREQRQRARPRRQEPGEQAAPSSCARLRVGRQQHRRCRKGLLNLESRVRDVVQLVDRILVETSSLGPVRTNPTVAPSPFETAAPNV
jgi:hypothetical protein